jgi:ribosomal protein S18 acetylase RimI-like enzyme
VGRHRAARGNSRRGRLRRRETGREIEVDGVLISTVPDLSVGRLLEERIIAFNVAKTGIDDAQPITGAVRGPDGEVLAGTHGWSWGGTCWIESLWVREDMRGRGMGSALLYFAEHEALARRCHQLALDTHSFQAPEFYLRHGFEIVGQLDGYPAGHARLVMRKALGPPAPAAPAGTATD